MPLVRLLPSSPIVSGIIGFDFNRYSEAQTYPDWSAVYPEYDFDKFEKFLLPLIGAIR